MRKTLVLELLLVFMSVTACGPVVYETTYRNHSAAPANHHATYSHYTPPVHKVPIQRQIDSIEVTLYADSNTYRGNYFQPIHIVISDGQYVEMPVRSRGGRHKVVYAHYHQKSLHFDKGKKCRGIHGASKYKYDKRWDKGHKYSSIYVGKEYDFDGLQLHVRNAPHNKHRLMKQQIGKVVIKNKNPKNATWKTPIKQRVIALPIRNRNNNVIKEKLHVIQRNPAKVPDGSFSDNRNHNLKTFRVKEKAGKSIDKKVENKINRPVIVKKILIHESSKRGHNSMTEKGVKRKSVKEEVDTENGFLSRSVRVDRDVRAKRNNTFSTERNNNGQAVKSLRRGPVVGVR